MSHYLFVCTSLFRETVIAGFETPSRKPLIPRMAMETPCGPQSGNASSRYWALWTVREAWR